LGLGLATAPIGAWLAVRGSFAAFPLWLGAGVLFWVAGFDIIYGCQDTEFDRHEGLHSLSVALDDRGALLAARGCHLMTVSGFAMAGRSQSMGWWWMAGVAVVALLFAYEHWLVRDGDLRQIDKAFFQLNSWVGLVFLAFVLGAVYLP